MPEHIKRESKPKSSEEAGINIRQFLQRCKKYWYIFLILPILTSIGVWFYLRYQVPVYEVKSAILIKDEKNTEGISATDLISKELGLSDNKKMLVDESKIMTSYSVIERIVRDLKLNSTVFKKNTIKDEELYGIDCPILMDSVALNDTIRDFKASLTILDNQSFDLTLEDGTKQSLSFGRVFNNKYGTFLINKSKSGRYAGEKDFKIVCKGIEKTAREIIKTITIELPKKESNILEPTIKTTTPQKAKDILQKIVVVYNEFSLNDKTEVSKNTLDFIDKRLLSLTTDLSSVEKNVESYKTREGITADGTPNIAYLFNKLDEYDSELVKLEVQNSILSGIENILSKKDPYFELLPTNLDLKSNILQNQIGDYNKLVLERNRLAKVAGDYNPTLKTLGDDIISIKRAIIDNITRLKQENMTLLARTKAKNNQFTSTLGKAPRNERELSDIKRSQNIKENIYLFLLQKQEETAISMIGQVADARIIDRPIVGEEPIGKKKSIFYLAALIAGVVLGFLYVIIRGLFSNRIESESDITAKISMPILGKIPNVKTANNWVVESGDNSLITEMFRNLRSNIHYVLPLFNANTKGKAILFTSTRSGEGKNFIATNLGMSLALANKKTVIVSLDLRKPKLATLFPNLKDKIGISNYLTSELYPQEIIQPSGKHNDLFVISSGNSTPNPSEMMMNPKLGQLFSYLKDNFDYIIVNTPPVGLVSDALSLKPYIDMSVFIIRLGHTKRTDIDTIQSFQEVPKLPNPTIIINGLKLSYDSEGGYYKNEGTPKKQEINGKIGSFAGNWIREKFSYFS